MKTRSGRAKTHVIDAVTSDSTTDTTPVASARPAPISCDRNGHTCSAAVVVAGPCQ